MCSVNLIKSRGTFLKSPPSFFFFLFIVCLIETNPWNLRESHPSLKRCVEKRWLKCKVEYLSMSWQKRPCRSVIYFECVSLFPGALGMGDVTLFRFGFGFSSGGSSRKTVIIQIIDVYFCKMGEIEKVIAFYKFWNKQYKYKWITIMQNNFEIQNILVKHDVGLILCA